MLKSFHFSFYCSHHHQVPPIYTKLLKNAKQLKLESQNQAYLIAPDYCLSTQCGTLLLSLVKVIATKDLTD